MSKNKNDCITNIEIIITLESGKKRIVELDIEDKKMITSVLANYFRDGIPTSDNDRTNSSPPNENFTKC